MKNLIIVESPAKARTISNFLGKDYNVIASKGHIRDLPKSTFGITIDKESGEFIPKYSIPRTANPIVKEIKTLAKSADTIYIATDEDREGEAIGYHIAKAIGKEPSSLPRIVFHEITKSAILRAIENPRKIDMDSINAQQTRRLLDRIVGYKLSPLLASKVQKGLSAGRVQSSTLKIIVDREKEIKAFKPVEFWSINAIFKKSIEASISEFDGTKIDKLTITNEDDANAILESAKSEDFIVDSIRKSLKNSKTPPPFMTSTLQQSASTNLGMSPKKSMMIAQKLYEGVKTPDGVMGVITYMRTDSLNLAKESVDSAREYILNSYGKEYLPPKAKVYHSKAKGAQEAHEAIRPTIIDFSPAVAKEYLSSDEYKLYRLIYNRFLASQMSDAKFEAQTILFKGIRSIFKATGSKLIFDGFHKVYGGNSKDKLLPQLKEGETVSLDKIDAKQNFTEPPPRYNEASIIKVLESLGIGRPSTYAPTISTLLAREYITVEKKRIRPTEIAFTVIKLLEDNFSDIVDSSFTAKMENNLDEIAEAKMDWQNTLKEFYYPFMQKIEEGKKSIKSLKVAIPTGEKCPQCEGELLLRKGRYGEFIACSNFPKCKYTKNVDGTEKTPKEEKSDEKCDKCGSDMVIKESRRGKFLACSAYPKCKNAKPLVPNRVLAVPCPKCGSKLEEKQGKRDNKFFGCQGYPKCKFISNIEPTDKKCPECGYMMGKKELKSGTVYQCLECKHKVKED
ncbi:DNA topoisomerase I [hydrothermal vent metagenome]|uniref:DNA topoisomerase n=1 Tax=hydrothermal vent metagenome TaxID=652676 RepID=A0A1W1EIS6_9ZZZZ